MMKRKKEKINFYVTTKSVFDELDFPPEVIHTLKIKSALYENILQLIEKRNYTQKELQVILKKPQPRISELINGKITTLSIEKLLEYISLLGASVSIKISEGKIA